MYETLIPTCFEYGFSIEGNFWHVPIVCDYYLYVVQGHHLHGMQCSMALSANSLFILYVRWKCLLFVLFVLLSSVIVFPEVILKK
jgi:hypothetical protein